MLAGKALLKQSNLLQRQQAVVENHKQNPKSKNALGSPESGELSSASSSVPDYHCSCCIPTTVSNHEIVGRQILHEVPRKKLLKLLMYLFSFYFQKIPALL